MAIELLTENFKVSGKSIKRIPLTESNQLIEQDGKQIKCRAAYEFPVWRLDKENLNERIYSTKLAEQVIKDSKTTTGLMNHPPKDVDVAKTFCVERNPHVRDGIMYVDGYLVGEGGQLAKEIIEAGGELGLSSSAYGDVQEKEVMLEGFEVERYADWVDSPSYEVFVKSEDNIETDEPEITEGWIKPVKNLAIRWLQAAQVPVTPNQEEDIADLIKEKDVEKFREYMHLNEKTFVGEWDVLIQELTSVEGWKKHSPNNSTLIKEEDTNITNNDELPSEIKENDIMADTKDTKLSIEEKNFKIGVSNMFKEVDALESPREKLVILNEIIEYCDGEEFAGEYINDAQSQITEINENLHTMVEKAAEVEKENLALKETKESVDTSVEELTEKLTETQALLEALTEKYDVSVELLDSLKEREIKLKEMVEVALAEKNGMVTASEYKELQIYSESLEADVKTLKEKNIKLRKARRKKADPKEEMDIDSDDTSVEEMELGEPAEEPLIVEPVEDDSYVFQYENSAVISYFEDLLESNPDVIKIKDEICSKRTLMEAQKTFLNLKDLVENIPSPYRKKLSEMTKPDDSVTAKIQETTDMNSLLHEGWE